MIVRPARALTLLARFQALAPGDLLLTGTPGGTALKAPPKAVEKIGALLPPAVKWKSFFNRQAKNPRYLREGDVITATIATPDGRIDLGEQRTPVAYAQAQAR
jgi:2-keto-4-pentenoate hydratase/2-oxohepta-3-ene-1,7-dioic acid hydratase in catechol pathway